MIEGEIPGVGGKGITSVASNMFFFPRLFSGVCDSHFPLQATFGHRRHFGSDARRASALLLSPGLRLSWRQKVAGKWDPGSCAFPVHLLALGSFRVAEIPSYLFGGQGGSHGRHIGNHVRYVSIGTRGPGRPRVPFRRSTTGPGYDVALAMMATPSHDRGPACLVSRGAVERAKVSDSPNIYPHMALSTPQERRNRTPCLACPVLPRIRSSVYPRELSARLAGVYPSPPITIPSSFPPAGACSFPGSYSLHGTP